MKIETLIYIYNLLDEKVQRTKKAAEAASAVRKAATPEDYGDAPEPIVQAERKAWDERQDALNAFEDFLSHDWH